MRIYTRSGDKGTTSLIYGERVSKNDIRVEAYGTCDEANSMIGFAASLITNDTVDWDDKEEFLQELRRVQTVLFHVGSEMATPTDKEVKWKLKKEHIDELEEQIDRWDQQLPELTNFILPAGLPASAALHSARTIVRRAERIAVALQEELETSFVISYLNRLSDYLFVAARFVNVKCGGEEFALEIE
ncbi:cob(I)yrinic acid a,c-diamide adenosyltransferase [Aquibacillus albus]|uniref:Corrinoid adenosyltransferase n=1 Tax=Aquibacillus albus TaxID=1168171 RepID=A0ABS2N2Y7_9BACI|nr:cob(I)yrinic acid a,c-diamide adenosyltransferase [Aquibacillus albus]MBM7572477.1 cob(I)alamin adenosyltransferase [Aquibacillus albus]